MITDRLHHWARTAPDRPFLLYEGRIITYGQMAAEVAVVETRLDRLGVRPGDRVALLADNHPQVLSAWFAIAALGAIAVPLNTALVGDGLRYVLEQSAARLLLGEAPLLAARADELAAVLDGAAIHDLDGLHQPLAAPSAPPPQPALPAGAPCAILYTSGTTGLPKGAVISHGCYQAAGADMVAALGITGADRILLVLPLFHANPQMYGVMSALAVGASLALQRRFSAGSFFDEARQAGATGFTYVGTVLSILEKRHPGRISGHGLRWGVGGGAPRPVWQAVEERFGIAVRELYGMTETGGWVSLNTPEASRVGSVGRARDGVAVGIVDDGGDALPPGGKGQIVVRSDRASLFFDGYWRRPELTADVYRNHWLHTGDRGWLDEDGYLYFDGRDKDLIRRGGEMIAPVEIELQVLTHPLVTDCAVVGVPDAILGEDVKAVIVAKPGFDPQALSGYLAGRLAAHMIPRYVEMVDALPRTETQKIQRHKLAALSPATRDFGKPGR